MAILKSKPKQKNSKDMKKRLRVKVNAPSNQYFDESFFEDNIDNLIEKLSKIKTDHKTYLKEIKAQGKSVFGIKYIEEWELIDEYRFDISNYQDYHEVVLQFYRTETDEEFKKRIAAHKKRSLAAQESANNRKLTAEKRERTLFENLKKKFEPDGNV